MTAPPRGHRGSEVRQGASLQANQRWIKRILAKLTEHEVLARGHAETATDIVNPSGTSSEQAATVQTLTGLPQNTAVNVELHVQCVWKNLAASTTYQIRPAVNGTAYGNGQSNQVNWPTGAVPTFHNQSYSFISQDSDGLTTDANGQMTVSMFATGDGAADIQGWAISWIVTRA